jgi:glucose uptake protein
MIFPASYTASLVLLVVSMVCWGSWANTQKAASKFRFELYYYDFAFGFVLLTVVAAFTLGSLNPSELTFQDNFLITGYRKMAYAVAAGLVFNLGNMLLAAAVSVAGMAVAFPMALGVALVIGTAWNLMFGTASSMLLSMGGAGLVMIALVIAGYAYSSRLDAVYEQSKKDALQIDPRSKAAKRSARPPSAARGIALGIIGGIALGLFQPLVESAREGDDGVAPYGLALLFAAGVLFATLVLGPFFFNFPVAGRPIRFRDYFAGTMRQHLLGLLGGLMGAAAILCSLLPAAASAANRVAPAPGYALAQGGTLLAALWGLLVWREFKGSSDRIRLLFLGVLVLYAAGIAVLSVARG